MKGTLAQLSPVSEEHRKAFCVWNGTVGLAPCLMHTCMLECILALWEGFPYTQTIMDVHVYRLSVGGCS